jgi:V8-like Glu-specific endopeptidase
MMKRNPLSKVILSFALALGACTQPHPPTKGRADTVKEDPRSTKSQHIIGGQILDEKDELRKTTVGIYNTQTKALCTGTIIGPRLVLTAAHCVQMTKHIIVFFGPNVENPTPFTTASQVAYPEQKAKKRDIGDMAVVQLKSAIPETHAVAELAGSDKLPSEGDSVTVVGFGATNGFTKEGGGYLRAARVHVIEAGFGETEFVTSQTEGAGICFGDSGGPAYLQKNGKSQLLGVASRIANRSGDPCRGLAVYTNISLMRPVLDQAIKTFEAAELAQAQPAQK